MRKKRALAALLALVMTAGLLPTAALAAPSDTGDAAGSVVNSHYSADENAYEIYPVPQEVNYPGGQFEMTDQVNVVADEGVDEYTIAFLDEILARFGRQRVDGDATAADKTNLVLRIDDGMTESAGHYDPYTLTADHSENENGVITVTGMDSDCVYYGLATLQMMFTSFHGEKFLDVAITDYSDTMFRGVIEGFYGTGFGTDEVRATQIEGIRDVKGNMFVFAPKADPYHGTQWDELYPGDKLASLKTLVDTGKENKVDFAWSVHIGKGKVLGENGATITDEVYAQNLQTLKDKFDQLYGIGVRNFHILNDDANSGVYARQVQLVNDINRWLKDEKRDCGPLIYCCAGYNTAWSNDAELTALQGLDEDVYLYWTGADVNSPITPANVNSGADRSNHKVATWLNYPCSEHAKSGLFLGNIHHYIKDACAGGLENQIGLFSNPIASPEANKVAYFQLLSWAWHREGYTDYEEELWESCFQYLQPEVAGAYRTIARNVSNCPNSSRVASFPESEYLQTHLDAVKAAAEAGEPLPAAHVTALQREFANILAAIDAMRAQCENETLKTELEPWLKSLTDVVNAAGGALEALEQLAEGDVSAAWSSFSAAGIALGTWDSYPTSNYNKDFSNVTVKAGSKRLQPFAAALLDLTKAAMAEALNPGGGFTGSEAVPMVRAGGTVREANDNARKIMDGDPTSYASYEENQAEGDYIGVDLGKVELVQEVDILQGQNDTHHDYLHKAVLEYSVSGKDSDWTELVTKVNSHHIRVEGLNVAARYVRLRLLEVGYQGPNGQHNRGENYYTYLREFTVTTLPEEGLYTNAADPGDAQVTVDGGRYTLSVPSLTLAAGEYVGVRLPELVGIRSLAAAGTLPAGVKLQYSVSGESWTDNAPAQTTLMGYVRLYNGGSSAASLTNVTLTAAEPALTRLSYVSSNPATVGSGGSGSWANVLDGDRTTSVYVGTRQGYGQYAIFDLGGAQPVHDVTMYVAENGLDIPHNLDFFVGDSPEPDGSWTKIGALRSTVPSGNAEPQNRDDIADPQYTADYSGRYFTCDGNGVEGRYLKLAFADVLSYRYYYIHELEVNKTMAQETPPAAVSASSGEAQSAVDGDLSTFFTPEAGAGHWEKLLQAPTVFDSVTVLRGAEGTAEVKVQQNGGWVKVGVLTDAATTIDLSQKGAVTGVRLEWAAGSEPSFAEVVLGGEALPAGTPYVLLPNIYEKPADPDGVTVSDGTALEDVSLPVRVRATLSDGSTALVDVDWACPDYDPDVAGTYAFTGTFRTGTVANPGCFTLSSTVTVQESDPVRNLALNRPATASAVTDNTTPGAAVDGDTDLEHTGWNSGFLKPNGPIDDAAGQDPQWLQVDLGAAGSKISEIRLYYQNNKVWPMLYRIETTDTPADDASWRTLVSVSRGSADKKFKELNANEGLAIADTEEVADVITRTTTPGIDGTVAVGRYVRFYVEKTNAQAPGRNVNLHELEIYGTNENLHLPVDVTALLASVTEGNVTADGGAVKLPAVPKGAALTVAGSALENVVANDGTVGGKNIGAREVSLLLRAWDTDLPDNYQQKNVSVTVPDHKDAYPADWFPAVTSPNSKPEVIPSLQEWYGYEGSFTLTKNSRIVLHDAANVGLSKAAKLIQADLAEITGLTLPIVSASSGGAADIFLRSLPSDDYDLGAEGYLMRVSAQGVQIYAPTYTGCLFGAVTAEQILWQAADHASIPMGVIRDYPAYSLRGIKIDVGRAPTRYQFLEDYAKILRWYKMSEYDLHINDTENPNAGLDNNIGFHRLESETFPSLKDMDGVKKAGVDADLVDEDYYNDPEGYGGNPVYTKAQWKSLTQLTKDYGMHLLTEIDMPGHALAYIQYVAQHPEEAAAKGIGPIGSTDTSDSRSMELLELVGPNADSALKFAKALWDEYTADGTITGDVVHIGMDEYWLDSPEIKDAFALFADELRQTVQENLGVGTKIRMWGATSGKFSTAPTVLNTTHQELAKDFELEIWFTGADDPVQRVREGYKIVNCEQSALYSCPGRHQRDVPNAEYVYNSWDPTMFGGQRLLQGEPNLLGAKAVMWGEQTQEGLTERDVHQRLLRAVSVVSEKTWGGQNEDRTFSDFELCASRLAEGPGTKIAMNVPSETALVLDYDFQNTKGGTVYDASGNGYDGALTGGTVDEEGWLTFDGDALLQTPLTTLSYPYTVSFDLKAGEGNTAASSLFSGYDGRIQVAGKNGTLSANVCSFLRDFGYAVPTDGTAVNVTLVGTFQATRLYIDGQPVAFLSQTGNNFQDGVAPGAITSYFSSVPLPLEKIGAGLHGALAHLKVYNKAFSAEEVAAAYAGTDDGLVNVAQNAAVGGSSYQDGDGYDGTGNAHQRTAIAAKAVDGETEEMYSFWRGDHAGSALTVDLGESHPIFQINAQWKGGDPSFTLHTSADGQRWDAFSAGTVTDARFVRLTLDGAGDLAELTVCEQVDKTALAETLTEAETVVAENALDFGGSGKGKALFDAVVLARAVAASPLATNAEAEAADAALQAALEAFQKPDPAPSPSTGGSVSSTTKTEVKEDGTKITTVTQPNGGKTITVTDPEGEELAKVELPATIPAPETKFDDLETVPWAEKAINNVAGLALVKGSGDNKYEPTLPMTRGALATVLHRLSQGKSDYEVTFKDVAQGKYYTEGVAWAAKAKVVTGYTSEIFAPNDIITREQLAVMLARYAKLIGMDTTAKASSLDQFADGDSTGRWAVNGVAWCVEQGLMKGRGQNTLDPTAEISRAEVAVLLDRFLGLLK